MNSEKDIREIIGNLKSYLRFNKEMGLEPPQLSSKTLEYLTNGIRSNNRIVDEYIETSSDNKGSATGQKSIDIFNSNEPQLRTDISSVKSMVELKTFIGDCKRCELEQGRTKIVFGEGAVNARLLFIGEGPGREEDLTGRPFVGEAGQLLTDIIEKGMGLNRKDVYICNVVKCRPPGNRDPKKDEIGTCIPFLKKQIEIIQPEIICVLGKIAAQELLNRIFKITHDRGTWYSFQGIPVMPTYHPAYIIRNPSKERYLKGHVWEDVKKIMKRLGLEVQKNG